jgi:hypothetical protein
VTAVAVSVHVALAARAQKVAAQRNEQAWQLEVQHTQSDLEKLRVAKNAAEAEHNRQAEEQDRQLTAERDKVRAREQEAATARAEAATAIERVREMVVSRDHELGNLIGRAESAEAALAAERTKVSNLTATNSALTEERVALEKKVEASERTTHLRDSYTPKPTHGKVVASQPGWGFTVLNIGDKQGARPNTTYVVAREGNPIGRLKITSVEPTQSIADVVPGTFPRGSSVRPGDEVVAWGDEKRSPSK